MELTNAPQDLGAFAVMAWGWAAEFVPRLGGALLIVILGLLAAKWAGRAVAGVAVRSLRVDETVRPVVSASVRYGIAIIIIVVAALGQLGVQAASILAVLGAAGLAIGLALQGTLSNIAAGLMLLWLRPFRVGEYVETANIAGIVREIGLFATTLDTFDGLYRFIPNSEIWNKPLINHSRNPGRMASFTVGIPLAADADRARQITREGLGRDSRAIAGPPPEVFIDTMTDNFVFLGVRAWIPARFFWSVHRDIVARLRSDLDGAGIRVQRLLHAAPDIGEARMQGASGTDRRPRPVAGQEPPDAVRSWRTRKN
jgi:small conductance mechanosensitive channel